MTATGKASQATPLKDLKPTLLVKLGSLAIHVEEMFEASHEKNWNAAIFDREAIEGIIKDPEVQTWLIQMDGLALLPVKRKR